MRTKQDFEEIKERINIEVVANLLMHKQGKNYIFPGERTASIKIYPESNSFYDFGRCVGGDCVRLWSHVKGCDSWQALQEVKTTFGLDTPNRRNNRALITKQEQARRQRLEAKKQKQEQWVRQVDELKTEVDLFSGILNSDHCEPLSWSWCLCRNRLTTVEGLLDLLCGI